MCTFAPNWCLENYAVYKLTFKIPDKTIAVINPYIATASQNIMEIKFLVLMRGAFTPPPIILTPVVCIPLKIIIKEIFKKHLSLQSCANNG